MKSLLILFTLISFSFGQYSGYIGYGGYGGEWTPAKINNLKLWLRADKVNSVTTINDSVSSWADQSGENNDVSQTTQDYRFIYSVSNKWLLSDGTNDYIQILAAQTGDVTPGDGDFSLIAWININDEATSRGIYGNNASARDNYYLKLIADGKLYFGLSEYGEIADAYTTTNAVPEDTSWHQVVVTRDGLTINVYIDNVLDTGSPFTAGHLHNLVDLNNFRIGNIGAAGQYFSGKISSILYYNVALTVGQVNLLYNYGR